LFPDRIKAKLLDSGWTKLNEAARIAELSDDGDEEESEETLEEREERLKEAQAERMAVRRKIVQEMWANASDADKAKVAAARQKEIEAKVARSEKPVEEGKRTPVALQEWVVLLLRAR
jgi:hypothetical protein